MPAVLRIRILRLQPLEYFLVRSCDSLGAERTIHTDHGNIDSLTYRHAVTKAPAEMVSTMLLEDYGHPASGTSFSKK